MDIRNSWKASLPIATLAILGGLVSCGPTVEETPQPPVGALARVGDEWLLQADLDYALESGLARTEAQAYGRLLDEMVLAEAARNSELDTLPAVRAALRRTLASRYLESIELSPVAVSDTEIATTYAASGDRFMEPRRVELAILRRKIEGSDADEARASIREALRMYRENGDAQAQPGFGSIAARFSDEPNTRYQGGVCGWISEDSEHLIVPDAVLEAAFVRSQPGASEKPVVAQGAAWAFVVMDFTPASRQPLEMVRETIKRELQTRRREKQRSALISRARANVALQEIQPPKNARDGLKDGTDEPPALP